MRLSFDHDLVEAAYLALGPRRDTAREAIYEIGDPSARDAAFCSHVSEWFRAAGLEKRVRDAFEEWPLVIGACQEAVVRRVKNPADEMAELFRGEEGVARVGVGIRSARIADGTFVGFLRHELCHIHDMLDHAFGYPGPGASGAGIEGSLHRERYGLLWDIVIDGRLGRRFPGDGGLASALGRHRLALERGFGFLPEAEREGLFAELAAEDAPRHDRLWAIASDPRRVNSGARGRLPGSACPVCGFTTFEWADEGAVAGAARAIGAEFPTWSLEDGCCGRCAELYAAVAGASVPATVLLPARGGRAAWGRAA